MSRIYAQFKYEFEAIPGEMVTLAVGESKQLSNGVVCKVHKYTLASPIMAHLSVSFDGGVWQQYEHGKRTESGKIRSEFHRLRFFGGLQVEIIF